MMLPEVLLVMTTLALAVNAYKTGAPVSLYDELCTGDMEPHHSAKALTYEPFYEITLVKECQSSRIIVTVNSTSSDVKENYLQGILMVARKGVEDKTAVLGSFSLLPNEKFFKLSDCLGKKNSSITHQIDLHQPSSSAYWMPPKDYDGLIQFQATIVWHTTRYFLNVRSPLLTYANGTVSGLEDNCSEATTPSPSSASVGVYSAIVMMLSLFVINLVQ